MLVPIVIFVLLLCGTSDSELPSMIRVGGLFDANDLKQQWAFRMGIQRVNTQMKILGRGKVLVPEVETVPEDNSYLAEKMTCQLLQKGIVGVFGPRSHVNAGHIKSITDSFEIPFVDTRRYLSSKEGVNERSYTVNLYPNLQTLGEVFMNIIQVYGWDSIIILYQNAESLIRLKALFDYTGLAVPSEKFEILAKQLTQSSEDEGYREVLREVLRSKSTNIILDCDRETVFQTLKQAQQIGLMSDEHHYFITDLDAHSLSFDDFKHSGTNFTTFRMIDVGKIEIQSEDDKTMPSTRDLHSKEKFFLDTETALMYDSIQVFAMGLKELARTQDISINRLRCDSDETWIHGSSLVNFMKFVEFKGISGDLKFDNAGVRNEFSLEILELGKLGMKLVGTWDPLNLFTLTRDTVKETWSSTISSKSQGHHANKDNPMANKTFTVTLKKNPPYTMLKEEKKKLEGNNRFEGFAIDLITEISKLLQFNITLKLVNDEMYGAQDEHGNWDGLIKEVLDGTDEGGADFVVADLSITTARASAVQFTIPWMNLGISIIYIKPRKAPPDLLSFLSPFTVEVWIYTGVCYVFVSIALCIIARFSPDEWHDPIPCCESSDELSNQFSLSNSLWFTIGTLLQQGSDVAPSAVSSRLLAGIWFFFALIITASYTANLAAFLTVTTLDKPIETAENLASQTKIKYGVVEGGSTMNFFENSNYDVYKKMWEYMSADENRNVVMMKNNVEGIKKVIESDGKYAFMMESSSIEYVTERKCTVSQIGGLLDNKGYGIAMALDSPYKNILDSAILKLQEGGVLFKLKTKWWKRKRGGGACQGSNGDGTTVAELDFANVIGVFIVTLLGYVAAGVISVLELLYGCYLQARKLRTSVWTELKEDLRFVFRCFGRSKKVRKGCTNITV